GAGYLTLPPLAPTIAPPSHAFLLGTAGSTATVWGAFLDRATSAQIGSLPIAISTIRIYDNLDFVVPDQAVTGTLTVTTQSPRTRSLRRSSRTTRRTGRSRSRRHSGRQPAARASRCSRR